MIEPSSIPKYRHDFTVPESAIDFNGHVNNVVYVQWMQDVALLHYEAFGGSKVTESVGASWVARSHKIEYLSPAFADDEVTALTWVASLRGVRSIRRYRFLRTSDQKLLAQGETEWIFVDAKTGRPRRTTEAVRKLMPVVAEGELPQ